MGDIEPHSPVGAPTSAKTFRTNGTQALNARKGVKFTIADWGKRLHDKGVRYWVTAALILILATTGSSYVYDYLHLKDARSYFFQSLLDLGPRPVEPRSVRIILVEDDDYWRDDEQGGRRPIKRKYLAQLVEKLVKANAHVIALDFDTRLPKPDSMEIPEEYREETRTLIQEIETAARKGKKIVLATPISYDAQGLYRRDSDIYQASGLCTRGYGEPADGLRASEAAQGILAADQLLQSNITCGYIALPYDSLVIPGPLLLADGSSLDSFSLAIARAAQPTLVSRLLARIGTNVRYANFISHDTFKASNSEFSARAVRLGTAADAALDSNVVIVGAHWSRDAAGRGPLVDLHATPVGAIVGAELHANFAEAFLDSRVFSATPEWALHVMDILFSLGAVVWFALIPSLTGKVTGIVAVLLVFFLATWAALHSFGVFLDVFVPLCGLGLHSLFERLLGPSERLESGPSMD
jgi:CHASE2 domain-containing sensor protein